MTMTMTMTEMGRWVMDRVRRLSLGVVVLGVGLAGCGDATGLPEYRFTLDSVEGHAWALVGDDVVITGAASI
jgi:hypothetical protein